MWKKNILFILVSFFYFNTQVNAQAFCPSPDGRYDVFKRKHFTMGIGPTFLYGDISDRKSNIGFALQAKYDRKVTKGLLLGVELQVGNLKNEEKTIDHTTATDEEMPRFVNNQYASSSFNITIHPFHYFNKGIWDHGETSVTKLLNGFYVGTGVGIVINNFRSLYVDQSERTDGMKMGGMVDGEIRYREKINSLIAPVVNSGIVYPLTDTKKYYENKGVWSAVVNAQISFDRDDVLDGYKTKVEKNMNNDLYTFYTLGIRYSF